ncbi:hypothetical protein EMIT019CA3_120053 [Bacillus pseudomycoides]
MYCLSASDKVIAITAIRLSIKALTAPPYFHTQKTQTLPDFLQTICSTIK